MYPNQHMSHLDIQYIRLFPPLLDLLHIYHYTNCLLMDAWYKGVLLGANQQALSEAGEALKNNRELVTENSYELAVNYAVLEVIYGQLGDTEKERMAEKKKRNILRVRV